jgi:hypothetical protein
MRASFIAVVAWLAVTHPSSVLAVPALWSSEPWPDPAPIGDGPFLARHNDRGTDPRYDYFVIEPSGATNAPVVVYFHGASPDPRPTDVRAQINRYVHAGATVVWLRLCDPSVFWCLGTMANQPSDGLDALDDALAYLSSPGHVHPQLSPLGRPQLIFVSHSMGAIVAMRAAALAATTGRAAPQAVLMHDPAGKDVLPFLPLEASNLSSIPADMLQIALVSERSVPDANSSEVVTRIHDNSPSARRFTWIVPSACALVSGATVSYACPALDAVADDVETDQERIYLSWHDETLDRRQSGLTFLARVTSLHTRIAYFDHTLACIREVQEGVAQSDCSGAAATNTGAFLELNGALLPAPPKVPYFSGPTPRLRRP